jgi:glycosyltransferase involved in cell wall biosynthesis
LAHEHDVSLLLLTNASRNTAEGDTPLGLTLRQFAEVRLGKQSRLEKRMKQLFCILRGRSPLLERYRLREVQETLNGLFVKQHYDIVLFESSLMAAEYRLPTSTHAIIDEHDIVYELLHRTYQCGRPLVRRWYNWWESRQVQSAELRRCSQARGVLVTSAREASLLKSNLPNATVHVVPNGVDLEHFRNAHNAPELDNHIVFTGSMESYPNIDAVLHFARECWPFIRSKTPRVTWAIVGRNPPSSVLRLGKVPGITVIGSVPDVKPYLAAATVAIAPLRIGSGTRLKILEAFAMRKAVVSTSLACEGLDVIPGKHLIVADQPEAFARQVLNLLQDYQRRAALANAGCDLAQSYSWEVCEDTLLSALRNIIEPKRPQTVTRSSGGFVNSEAASRRKA